MKRLLTVLTVLSVGSMVSPNTTLAGNPKPAQGDARRSMGNLAPKQPAPRQTAVQPPAAEPRRDRQAHGQHRIHNHPYNGGVYRRSRSYYPYDYGCGYGYDPYQPRYAYSSHYSPYYPAPVFLPAEVLYGPQAVNRFMGWGNFNRPPANVNVFVAPDRNNQGAGNPAPNANRTNPTPPVANRQSQSEAQKYIGHGDTHFGSQAYQDAYLRYRKAARAAPQSAEAYFRQCWALMGMGRPDLAARAVRRGLDLDPGWPDSRFNVDELYGDNQMAKRAHADALAKAAEEDPKDSDLLFMLGVRLHFDGEPDRAAIFFKRAKQLAPGDTAHLDAFTKM